MFWPLVLIVAVAALNVSEPWESRMQQLVWDTSASIANSKLETEKITSMLQTRIITSLNDEIDGDGEGCFGRGSINTEPVEERVVVKSPLSAQFFFQIANLTLYQSCSKSSSTTSDEEEVDVWDLNARCIEFNQQQQQQDCNDQILMSTSPLKEQVVEAYGLVISNAVKLSLYGETVMPQQMNVMFKQVSTALYNSLEEWPGMPHYFLFKLLVFTFRNEWKLRGVEYGKGVIPRDLRKAAVDIAQNNAATVDQKWQLLYSAPECTLLFPQARVLKPRKQILENKPKAEEKEEEEFKRKRRMSNEDWQCSPIVNSNAPITEPSIGL